MKSLNTRLKLFSIRKRGEEERRGTSSNRRATNSLLRNRTLLLKTWLYLIFRRIGERRGMMSGVEPYSGFSYASPIMYSSEAL